MGSWAGGAAMALAPTAVPAGDGRVELTLQASASDVKLWWPAGQGAQVPVLSCRNLCIHYAELS
jgi:hypothetical protein